MNEALDIATRNISSKRGWDKTQRDFKATLQPLEIEDWVPVRNITLRGGTRKQNTFWGQKNICNR